MSRLWTPPDVTQELRDLTAVHNRVLLEVMDFDTPGYGPVRRELESYDPLLRLGRAKERAHLPGVRPGFWHLIRLVESGPYYCEPLTDVDGGFAEPSLGMFDALRKSDLQNPQVVAARKAEDERIAAEKAAEQARDDDDRRGELLERVKAVTDTQVSMNTDTPWTQNQSAASRRDAATRKEPKAA